MESSEKFTLKFTDCGVEYIKKSFTFAVLLLLSRFIEIAWVSNFRFSGTEPQLIGLLYDLPFTLRVAGYFYLPYLAIYFINPKGANYFFITLSSLLIIGYLALIAYFKTTSILLGSDLFAYNRHDLIHTVQAANISLFWSGICFLILFLLIIGLYHLSHKIRLNKTVQSAFLVLILFSLFIPEIKPDVNHFKNEYDFYLAENKLNFFFTSSLNYYQDKHQMQNANDLQPEDIANDKTLIEHDVTNPGYPFFHKDETGNVLRNLLNINHSVKPNLVFIIVESLGTAYSGPANYMGSFTPFLDSLANKSLYWKDFISSAGRTFEVLPTMFGSLPFGETGFSDLKEKMPDHLSLLRLLKKNGYTSSFFYGGETVFDNMDVFLKKQETDHIVESKDFDKRFKKMPSDGSGFSWGYGDNELFQQYLLFKEQKKNNNPSIDVLLTLSMHFPFLINDQKRFDNRVTQRMKELKLTDKQCEFVTKYIEQFATIMYTDEAFRHLFHALSGQPSFKNSIFIITGDHRMPEIPISNQIDRFHVPLIIYSPMLKRPKTMEAVSSQFNITPTFVSLLRNSYQLKFPSGCHWIGFELDTAATFRNKHVYPIMRNKNELVDLLVGNNLLSMSSSYSIDKDFNTTLNNNEVTKELKKRLIRFKQLNAQVCKNNKLIPDSIYSKW